MSEEGKTRGFLYTAFGAKYIAEARISAKSVKQADPSAKICVVTDEPLKPDAEFDIILPITPPDAVEQFADLDTGAYYRKIEQFGRSPFDSTIYLDSDTYVTGSLKGLFDLLDHYDLLVTMDGNAEVNYRFEQTEAPFTSIPKEFGAFNCGVLCYRKNSKTRAFFERWRDNHLKYVQHHTVNDQPGFRLTLFETDVRYHVLPVVFNWFSWIPFFIPSGGRVTVMHGRNPWMFRWAKHLDAETAKIVGPVSLKHQAIYHAARILHWLSRKGIIPPPRL